MIERYADPEIRDIWSDENKLLLWQEVELAVIQAMANLDQIKSEIHTEIAGILQSHPIDLEWWLAREKVIGHDLNAFIDERMRLLPLARQQYFHSGITSYDTEEPAFAKMLQASLNVVGSYFRRLGEVLQEQARRYQYTVMVGRTHGQWAQLQSFGKRFLTWFQDCLLDKENLVRAIQNLRFSKLSGAIGNYGGISPSLEAEALHILGFMPYYGATQIMPRELYAPLGQALCQLVCTLDKIALTIRLGARSGCPIYQEPFSKEGKGSSIMPQKKNPVNTEQRQGMADMAKAYLHMIMDNIRTWEERDIGQSCVERVAWPDLFHVVIHSLKRMTKVLEGLVVYPDNMLREIQESRGIYASAEAKEFLKREGAKFSLSAEDAYRIVQLAAFIAFEPSDCLLELRQNLPTSLDEANGALLTFQQIPPSFQNIDIKLIIREALLRVSSELAATPEDVEKWNKILERIFANPEKCEEWNDLFSPSFSLKHEAVLYREILREWKEKKE